jgi:hypothetical protein
MKEYGITRQTVREILAIGDRRERGGGDFTMESGPYRVRVAGRMRKVSVRVAGNENAERIQIFTVHPVLTEQTQVRLREYRERRSDAT